jgi:superfamily I DNA and RNA helicase
MAGIGHPISESPSYWDEEFPNLLLEFLTDPIASSECQFDVLVLDEAQDLMARPALFEALEAFLRGGWQDGRFAVFADFENQVLTDLAAMDAKRMALKRSARPAELSLDENCRNYAKVGAAACSLAALEQDPFSGYMRGPGTLASYDIEYHSTAEEEMQHLRKWILEVRQKGYRDEDVVFLSFRADEQSAAQRLRREGFQMVRVGSVDRGFRFASVQAFKGLEAKVVVLTDVHLDWPALSRNLIYVGLTRALELVRVSCNREHASALLRLEKE